MVKHTGYMLLAFMAIVAVGGIVWTVSSINAAGSYSAYGGGRYYYGPQIVQLSPEDACKYAGCYPAKPTTVYTNEFGTKLVVCHCAQGSVGIPLVQTARVY